MGQKREGRRFFLLVLAVCSLAGQGVLAASEDYGDGPVAEMGTPEADASVALLSQYVWRGYALSNDSLVIQPSLTVAYRGLGLNIWGNLDSDQDSTGPMDSSSNLTETDLTLSYDWTLEGVGFGIGYIYYAFDNAHDTQEFYGVLSMEMAWVSPSLTVYKDIDFYPGWYLSLGLASAIPVTDELTLDVGVTAGYLIADSTQVDGGDFSNFFDGLVSLSLTYPLNQYLSITPEISYSFPLSNEGEDVLQASNASFGSDEDIFYGGVSASFSF